MRSLVVMLAVVAGCSSSESSPAAVVADAAPEAGAACVFNRDCPTGQYCDCTIDGCTCRVGARGTGKSGVDACSSAGDCESGLCVEGTSGFVCSGPCDAGCGDKLPKCVDVASLGPICAREPASPKGATGTLSGKTWAFDRAYFGYDYGDAGPTATALELQAGSDGSCPPPKKDPQATIVFAGLPSNLEARSYPVKATLLGFDPALPIKSTETGGKPITLAGLQACSGDTTRVCAFDLGVSLVFPEGSVTGTVRAIHCDSMDAK